MEVVYSYLSDKQINELPMISMSSYFRSQHYNLSLEANKSRRGGANVNHSKHSFCFMQFYIVDSHQGLAEYDITYTDATVSEQLFGDSLDTIV